MESLAIVGSGIAGMGCAYLLRNKYKITVFEKDSRAGGHTNTVTVDEDGTLIPIDTGFMVYNEATYPNLTRLFSALGVVSKSTDMSFSVQQRGLGFEWSGTGFNRLFGDRVNLFRPRFWRFLFKLDQFNKEALLNVNNSAYDSLSVRQYADKLGYGEDFLDLYLLPMMSALWSASPQVMLGFPIASLLRFMRSHGLLSMHGQHQWLTVDNGSITYLQKLQSLMPGVLQLNQGVKRIRRQNGKVILDTISGEQLTFDKCVIAAHADQAAAMLEDIDDAESETLASFRYQSNLATLHTYAGVMPRNKANWASWNYRLEKSDAQTSTHYWMNSLQNMSKKRDYFISIGGADLVPDSHILSTIHYEHPVFTVEALNAQSRLIELNRRPGQIVLFAG